MSVAPENDGNEPAEWALAVPFVVCKSNGGPFDDTSFAGGYVCGMVDVILRFTKTLAEPVPDQTVHRKVLPQLDLIAMRNGYTMDAKDSTSPEWVYVSFRKED